MEASAHTPTVTLRGVPPARFATPGASVTAGTPREGESAPWPEGEGGAEGDEGPPPEIEEGSDGYDLIVVRGGVQPERPKKRGGGEGSVHVELAPVSPVGGGRWGSS